MLSVIVEMISEVVSRVVAGDIVVSNSGDTGARFAFRWGASFSALLLLILNQIGRRSSLQASLLALILITSIPEAIFQIFRGEFGSWVACLAIAANYCFPEFCPVSRFLLFVVVPDWLANELRNSITGGVFCLLMWIVLFIEEIHGSRGCSSCECTLHCSGYWSSMVLLLFFTILYLCLGPW